MRHNFEPTDSTHSADRVAWNFPGTESALANSDIQCQCQMCEQENINIIEANKESTLQLKLPSEV